MPSGKYRKKSYPWTIVLLLAAVLVAVLIGISTWASSPTPTVSGYPKEISPQQAQTEIANGAMLLDVREVDEYTQSHIAGSLLVPLSNLSTRLQEMPQDRLIIVVCRTGVRAAQGRDFLLASGFSNVTSLSGGILAWVAAGFPMESGVPPQSITEGKNPKEYSSENDNAISKFRVAVRDGILPPALL